MHFLSAEFTKKTLGKKKCPCSFLPADVINHKSQDRWNCCRGLEISTALPKPLHLLFCDTAKQTKTAWYSSSIFLFMFICLFCPQHCLVYLLFGLKNRLDWDQDSCVFSIANCLQFDVLRLDSIAAPP